MAQTQRKTQSRERQGPGTARAPSSQGPAFVRADDEPRREDDLLSLLLGESNPDRIPQRKPGGR